MNSDARPQTRMEKTIRSPPRIEPRTDDRYIRYCSFASPPPAYAGVPGLRLRRAARPRHQCRGCPRGSGSRWDVREWGEPDARVPRRIEAPTPNLPTVTTAESGGTPGRARLHEAGTPDPRSALREPSREAGAEERPISHHCGALSGLVPIRRVSARTCEATGRFLPTAHSDRTSRIVATSIDPAKTLASQLRERTRDSRGAGNGQPVGGIISPPGSLPGSQGSTDCDEQRRQRQRRRPLSRAASDGRP